MILLDKKTFEEEVLNCEDFVLVDYFGDGCAPCEALLPEIMDLSKTHGDKVKFTKLNTTKARRLAISQKVLGLPTVILYKNGEKVATLTKEDATKSNIEQMILTNVK